MKIDIEKMANALNGERNEQLLALMKKNKNQDMFYQIMDWTDLSHACDYELDEYLRLLKNLPQCVECMIERGSNIGYMANRLIEAKNCSKQRRLL